jgi:phosphatidylglycerophosphatase A
MRRPSIALAFATGFGVGYVPVAPGTFGSLLGLAVWTAVSGSLAGQVLLIVLLFGIGGWSAGAAERKLQADDPGPVVIDEVLGMLVTLFLNPVGWGGALLAFLLFRFFDVVKPYPADRLERLHGGFGVMADDVMAAVYANIGLRLLLLAGRALETAG